MGLYFEVLMGVMVITILFMYFLMRSKDSAPSICQSCSQNQNITPMKSQPDTKKSGKGSSPNGHQITDSFSADLGTNPRLLAFLSKCDALPALDILSQQGITTLESLKIVAKDSKWHLLVPGLPRETADIIFENLNAMSYLRAGSRRRTLMRRPKSPNVRGAVIKRKNYRHSVERGKARVEESPDIRGYLKKRGKNLLAPWQCRWFQTQGPWLCYYKDKLPVERDPGIITAALAAIDIRQLHEIRYLAECKFELVTGDDQIIRLEAATPGETKKWVRLLLLRRKVLWMDKLKTNTPEPDVGMQASVSLKYWVQNSKLTPTDFKREDQIVFDSLSEEEKVAVQSLRARLGPPPVPCPCSSYKRQYQFSNLIKFVRARNGDLDKAEAMLRAALAWRVEFKLDDKCLEWARELDAGTSPRARLYERYIWIGHMGTDSQGAPVRISRMGYGDPGGLSREGGYDLFLLHHLLLAEEGNEWERHRTLTSGKFIPGLTEIYDMVKDDARTPNWWGRSYGAAGPYRKVGPYLDLYYPERLRRVFIIRVPSLFFAVWKLFVPLLPVATRAKMSIHASEWTEEMLKFIPSHQIPFDLYFNGFGYEEQPDGGYPKEALEGGLPDHQPMQLPDNFPLHIIAPALCKNKTPPAAMTSEYVDGGIFPEHRRAFERQLVAERTRLAEMLSTEGGVIPKGALMNEFGNSVVAAVSPAGP